MMEYSTKSNKIFIFLMIMMVPFSDMLGAWYLYLFLVLGLFLSLLTFKLSISDGCILYRIFLHKYLLYKRTAAPAEIEKIVFKRSGWAKKSAIIHIEKRWNIRMTEFEPKTCYEDLEQFANQNDLVVIKTKDYKMLERYYT